MTTEVFTASGTFTPPSGVASVDVLIVAGGAAGGRSNNSGGGGGAGGVRWLTAQAVTPGVDVTVTVGGGGIAPAGQAAGGNGGDSAFGALVAVGGGGGGWAQGVDAEDGGSGGGGLGGNPSFSQGPGLGTAGQGYDGGLGRNDATVQDRAGGGGGGGGAVGGAAADSVGGNGGAGVDMSSQVGTGVGVAGWFGGGGGGGCAGNTRTPGGGGTGGGGSGGKGQASTGVLATPGAANTGGGGGGGGGNNNSGATHAAAGDGGSGVVIVIYTILPPGVPTSVAETHDHNSATLTWAAPATGGTPDGYNVRIDGGTPVDVGDVLTYDFTGLDPVTTYDLEVQAYNDGGDSGWVSVEATTDDTPPLPPPPSGSPCGCQYDWRVEVLDLATGVRKRFLTPLSFDFEERLNEVGSGNITVPVRSVTMLDVWPHLTSVAFLRISGPDATPFNPVCEFIGLIEDVHPDSGGTLQIGIKSIEKYLQYRLIHADTTYTATDQTEIGANLVNLGAANGVPLAGSFAASAFPRDRSYPLVDRKKILEAILQLTEVISGPDYRLIHSQSASTGAWETEVLFQDEVGNTTPRPLNARRGIISYALAVSAGEHTNRVIGIGDVETLAYDADESASSIYPLFERSEAYSDVSVLATVEEHAEGSVQQDRHPMATPSIVLAGLDMIAPLSLGDYITLTMGHGAIQYQGVARVVGIAWSSSDSAPTTATVTLVPQDDAVTAILNAPPSSAGCC